MAFDLSSGFESLVLNSIRTSFSNGVLRIYNGVAPATADGPPTGTLLVEIQLPSSPFTTPSGGMISRNGAWVGSVVATGTASYYRLVGGPGYGAVVMQGDVMLAPGSTPGVLYLPSTSLTAGEYLVVDTFNISLT